MAGCGGKKKMAYGGKVKKMQEGGSAGGNNIQDGIEKLDRQIAMLKRQAAEQAQAMPQRSRLGGAPGAMQALGGPQGGANLGGMKKGGKVRKMKEGGMTRNQEAYAEGLRIGKGKPVLRNIDKILSEAVSTPKERRMLKKGYDDMLKAKKYKKKAVKKKAGGSVKCKRDGICVKGKTKGRMV